MSWRMISQTWRSDSALTWRKSGSVLLAIAVAITNIDHVLAYVGVGEHNYRDRDDTISPTTRQVVLPDAYVGQHVVDIGDGDGVSVNVVADDLADLAHCARSARSSATTFTLTPSPSPISTTCWPT
jgi:hypothetical protein